MTTNIWNIAKEEASKVNEIELVIYAKIGNYQGLQKAVEKIHQRELIGQLLLKDDPKPQRWRIREIDDASYEFTVKKRVQNANGLNEFIEQNTTVDKDFWELMKPMAHKAHDKTRYIFIAENVELTYTQKDFNDVRKVSVPKIKYEIDVYTPPGKAIPTWCKIDVELQDVLQYMAKNYPEIDKAKVNVSISHLPFEPTSPTLSSDPDPAKQAALGKLWDTQFNLLPVMLA